MILELIIKKPTQEQVDLFLEDWSNNNAVNIIDVPFIDDNNGEVWLQSNDPITLQNIFGLWFGGKMYNDITEFIDKELKLSDKID